MPLRWSRRRKSTAVTTPRFSAVTASLDLTEDNVRQVLADARVEASRPPFGDLDLDLGLDLFLQEQPDLIDLRFTFVHFWFAA